MVNGNAQGACHHLTCRGWRARGRGEIGRSRPAAGNLPEATDRTPAAEQWPAAAGPDRGRRAVVSLRGEEDGDGDPVPAADTTYYSRGHHVPRGTAPTSIRRDAARTRALCLAGGQWSRVPSAGRRRGAGASCNASRSYGPSRARRLIWC